MVVDIVVELIADAVESNVGPPLFGESGHELDEALKRFVALRAARDFDVELHAVDLQKIGSWRVLANGEIFLSTDSSTR